METKTLALSEQSNNTPALLDFTHLGIAENDIVLADNKKAVEFQLEYYNEFKKIQDEYSNVEIKDINDKEGYKKASEGVLKARKLQITAEKFFKELRDDANKFAKLCTTAEKEVVAKVEGFRLTIIPKIQKIDQEVERLENERIDNRVSEIIQWNSSITRDMVAKLHDDEFKDLVAFQKQQFEYAQKMEARKLEIWKLDPTISSDIIIIASDEEFTQMVADAIERKEKAEAERIEFERLKAEQVAKAEELARLQAELEAEQRKVRLEQEQKEREAREVEAKRQAEIEAREKALEEKERAIAQAEEEKLISEKQAKAEAEWKANPENNVEEIGILGEPNAKVLEFKREDSIDAVMFRLSFIKKLNEDEVAELRASYIKYQEQFKKVG